MFGKNVICKFSYFCVPKPLTYISVSVKNCTFNGLGGGEGEVEEAGRAWRGPWRRGRALEKSQLRTGRWRARNEDKR